VRRTVVLSCLLFASAARAYPAGSVPPAIRRALAAASVQLEPVGCSGVLAVEPDLVLTARHCFDGEPRAVDVRFADGQTRTGDVAGVDEVADQVVLRLREPVPIAPLALVRRPQIPGTVLYFEGNPSRPRFQSARLDRIGRCESLPRLENALFTSIDGIPGDSGAPLVDGLGRIVGLVHGGARCRIATPADTLGRLVDRARAAEREHPATVRRPGMPPA
jgi:S1-C subfamily serine protease